MVKVDQNKCIGCGMCAGICPEVFQMNLTGKAEVIANQENDSVSNAIHSCPVEAISLEK